MLLERRIDVDIVGHQVPVPDANRSRKRRKPITRMAIAQGLFCGAPLAQQRRQDDERQGHRDERQLRHHDRVGGRRRSLTEMDVGEVAKERREAEHDAEPRRTEAHGGPEKERQRREHQRRHSDRRRGDRVDEPLDAVRHARRIRNSANGGPKGRGNERQRSAVSSGGARTIVERTLVTNHIRQCITGSAIQPVALNVAAEISAAIAGAPIAAISRNAVDALQRSEHVLDADERPQQNHGNQRLRQVAGEHPERAADRKVHRPGDGELSQQRKTADDRPQPERRDQEGDEEEHVRRPQHGHGRQRRHHQPGVDRHRRGVVRQRQTGNPEKGLPVGLVRGALQPRAGESGGRYVHVGFR